MSENPIDPELKAVESTLADLVPAKSHIDRELLMFQAGLASARSQSPALGFSLVQGRPRWLWPAIAAGLGALAWGEGVMLATRKPEVRVVEHVVVMREPAKAEALSPAPPSVVILSHSPEPSLRDFNPSPIGESDALRLRRQILKFGVDEMPERRPLLTDSGGDAERPDKTPLFPGVLRRPDYEKIIDSGGSS